MPTITEQAAQRYAAAAIRVLAEDFPGVDASYTTKQIVRHVQNPAEPFETCIDLTREWRLHREDAFNDRRRVLIACHKDNWTEADIRFSDSVNARLRAIKLED
jgi:hypothetical protein